MTSMMTPRTLLRPKRAGGGGRPVTVGLVLSVLVIAVALAWTIAPGLFAPGDPAVGAGGQALRPPGLEHWFGTDATGRDVYTRVVHGASQSMAGAVIAVSVGLVVGTTIGVLAGSRPGPIDEILMRAMDVLLAIPALLLSLSIIILLGFGTANAALAVGVTSIAVFARLARSQVVTVRVSEFVEAAYGSGGTFGSVLLRHVLPNSMTAVLALAALQFGSAILQIATLGFLGYGAPPPTPEWGLLVAEGRDYVATAWWLTTLPGAVIAVVVLATNRLSRAVQRGAEE